MSGVSRGRCSEPGGVTPALLSLSLPLPDGICHPAADTEPRGNGEESNATLLPPICPGYQTGKDHQLPSSQPPPLLPTKDEKHIYFS